MEARETQQQLLLRHVRQLSAEVAELKQEGPAPLTDTLAHWLAAQFVVAAKTAADQAEGGCIDLKTLRGLSADVVALRRGDHDAERLKVERERLELARRNSEANFEKRALEWSQKPRNKQKCCGSPLTPEERQQRIRIIFGLVAPPVKPPGL